MKTISVSSLPQSCRKRINGKLPVKAKTFEYWQVQGMSWRGKVTKRDGKRITCGHEHKSRDNCKKCEKKMRKERPGNCQCYNATYVKGYMIGYAAY